MDPPEPDLPGPPPELPDASQERCSSGARRAGRPRSQTCRIAVLNAAYDILSRDGLGSFTIERVAAAAAVGRNTIYRWWPSRGALAVDCLLDAVQKQPRAPATGDVIQDLVILVRQVIDIMRGEAGRIIAGIVAEAQSSPDALVAFEDGYLRPRRLEFEKILSAGVASGQLRSNIDLGMTIDLLVGALLCRRLIVGGLEDPGLADRVVVSVVTGCTGSALRPDEDALRDRPAPPRSSD